MNRVSAIMIGFAILTPGAGLAQMQCSNQTLKGQYILTS
jgi:hypothetical protein